MARGSSSRANKLGKLATLPLILSATQLASSGAQRQCKVGGRTSTRKFIEKRYAKATFSNPIQSALYHWERHGVPNGLSFLRYTHDARAFFRTHRHEGRSVIDLSGNAAILLEREGQRGLYTPEGKIIYYRS